MNQKRREGKFPIKEKREERKFPIKEWEKAKRKERKFQVKEKRMGESKKEESSWSKKPEEMRREVFGPDNILTNTELSPNERKKAKETMT